MASARKLAAYNLHPRPVARAQVSVVAAFLENFCGDNVRFLARSFGVPGDHDGQTSVGHRVPYGAVSIVTPFNFPIEIPALQVMGALYMGNKPLVKVDSKVSVVFEQFLRLAISLGLPATDVDMVSRRARACAREREGARGRANERESLPRRARARRAEATRPRRARRS